MHYNGSNSFLFVNATKVYQFKAKHPEIKDYALCIGNVSKDFTVNNMKKTGSTLISLGFLRVVFPGVKVNLTSPFIFQEKLI